MGDAGGQHGGSACAELVVPAVHDDGQGAFQDEEDLGVTAVDVHGAAVASRGRGVPSTLEHRRLLREQLHALRPTGHPLATHAEITLADLAAEAAAFWSADTQPRGRAWLAHALVTAGHSGELTDITPSTVTATVAAGAAITVLAPSFSRILNLRGTALVPVAGLFLEPVVAWRRDDHCLALRRFLAAAHDSVPAR